MMKSRFLAFSRIARPLLGGVPAANQNSLLLARFAHNMKKEKELYEANVWVKPWLQLQLKLKGLQDVTSIIRIPCSGPGCKKGSACREVPRDDFKLQHIVYKFINWILNTNIPYNIGYVSHSNYELGRSYLEEKRKKNLEEGRISQEALKKVLLHFEQTP